MSEDKPVYSGEKNSKKSCPSMKRNVKKRKPPNAHQTDRESVCSSSVKKLKESSDMNCDIEVQKNHGYRIIDFYTVFTALFQLMVCKDCHGKLQFSEANIYGLGFKILITCENCKTQVFVNSCPEVQASYEINRRIFLAFRLLGIGLAGITKLCALIDLPNPIYHIPYDSIISSIATATEAVRSLSLRRAAEEEKKESAQKGEVDGLTVSTGGSWRNRDSSSLFGIVSLIGSHSGKILDVLVESKYCKACEFWKDIVDTSAYEEWNEEHNELCEANYECSAGKVEVDAVVQLFTRSEKLHQVKYLNYIEDDDCMQMHKRVIDAKPYGNNFEIKKKECIDRVQKRMKTRLQNVAKKNELGGKRKLTRKLIDELSVYYGLAIRKNALSVADMKREIWATLYHKISTDENPRHDDCPPGIDSWCTWQSALSFLGKTNNYKHETPMSQMVFEAIKSVYEDLSNDDLLSRCLGGYTQNRNESFNSLVWSMAPKLDSKTVFDVAVDLATIVFNDGFNGILQVLKALNIKVGPNCYNFCTSADNNRIKYTENALSGISNRQDTLFQQFLTD